MKLRDVSSLIFVISNYDIKILLFYIDESYAYLFDSILPLYNIPYNIDTKRSMTHHPVMEMIRSLIEVIQSNGKFPMLRLLKTDVLTASYLKVHT